MIEEFFIWFALIYPLVRLCLLFFNETIFAACCFRCCDCKILKLFLFFMYLHAYVHIHFLLGLLDLAT